MSPTHGIHGYCYIHLYPLYLSYIYIDLVGYIRNISYLDIDNFYDLFVWTTFTVSGVLVCCIMLHHFGPKRFAEDLSDGGSLESGATGARGQALQTHGIVL